MWCAVTVPPPEHGRRPSAAAWPIWIVFAALLIPGVVGVWCSGVLAEADQRLAARERGAAGRSEVVVGALVDADTTSGMPRSTPIYLLRVPAAPGESEQVLRATGPSSWGFPPSSDHPSRRAFLVIVDHGGARVIADGPVGTVRAPTAESAARAEAAARSSAVVAVASRIVVPVVLVSLLTVAIVRTARRVVARRTVQRRRTAELRARWGPPRGD